MADNTLLQSCVVLRTAEDVGHELAENRAATHELNHARRDRRSQERAPIEAAHNACRKFKFARKCGANPVGVALRIALGDGFAEKFSGAHSVEEAFAGERVNESSSVPN